MRIEYVASKSQREVRDSIGEALIDRKLARRVHEARQLTPEPAVEAEEISPRTGKPKRRYKRRDMTAEG